jgi:hypothetical protein
VLPVKGDSWCTTVREWELYEQLQMQKRLSRRCRKILKEKKKIKKKKNADIFFYGGGRW